MARTIIKQIFKIMSSYKPFKNYRNLNNFVSKINKIFRIALFYYYNHNDLGFNFASVEVNSKWNNIIPEQKFSIQDFIQENILWAVPKKRRSLEKRMTRKFGLLDRHSKLFLKQKDLLVCIHCGCDYKRGYLCKNCYTKVMDETKRMQDRISEELKLDPIDKEVVVLYKGEKDESQEFWKDKRIVEMPVERPVWFSKNLLQKSTTTTSDTNEIKPDNLG
ncbi:hypothetical protein PGB90_000221 [Kerria lacca]